MSQLFDLALFHSDLIAVALQVILTLGKRQLEALQLRQSRILLVGLVLRFLCSYRCLGLSVLKGSLHIVVLLLELLDLAGMIDSVPLLLLLQLLDILLQLDLSGTCLCIFRGRLL